MRRLQNRRSFSWCRTIAIALSLALHVALLASLTLPALQCNGSTRVASPVYDGQLQVYLDKRPLGIARKQTSTVTQPTLLLRHLRRRPVRQPHVSAQRQVETQLLAHGRALVHSARMSATLDLRLPAQTRLTWSSNYVPARMLPGRSSLDEHGLRFRFRSQSSLHGLLLRTFMHFAGMNVCGSLASVADVTAPKRLRLGMTRHMLWLAKRAYNCR